MSIQREKERPDKLTNSNLSSPSSSSGDESSEAQTNLQDVLVTVRIQRPPKPKNVKRVRFNNLVEVRFIPRVNKHNWHRYQRGRDFKDDRKKYRYKDQENAVDEFKGEEKDYNQDVAIETVYKFNQIQDEKDSYQDRKQFPGRSGGSAEEMSSICDDITRNVKLSDDQPDTQHNNIEVNVTDKLGNDCHGRNNLSEINIQVNYSTTRQVFTPPKIVVGENYRGTALKPAFPRLLVNRCRTYPGSRQMWKQPFQDFNVKPINHLCKQAQSFISKDAEPFLTECDDQNGVQTGDRAVSETQTTPTQTMIPFFKPQDHASFNLTELNYKSPNNFYPESSQVKRLNSNLAAANDSDKCIFRNPLKDNSYCRMYLPQLHRKEGDIYRLNENILRRNPKYTKGIADGRPYLFPQPPMAFPKHGKFDKLNNLHQTPMKSLSGSNQKVESVLQFRYSTRDLKLVKGKEL